MELYDVNCVVDRPHLKDLREAQLRVKQLERLVKNLKAEKLVFRLKCLQLEYLTPLPKTAVCFGIFQ
jgi:hypothetical protein